MKTLFITEWFMPDVGGSITIYDNVYRRYRPGEVIVLTKITKGAGEFDRRSGIPTYRLPFIVTGLLRPESLLVYTALFFYALSLIIIKRIKIIHCDQVLRAGLIGYLLNKLFRIPYIIYAHGEEITLRKPRNKNIMARIYNSACAVVANSDNTKTLLLDLGVKNEKIKVIYPGVDLERFNPGLDPSLIKRRYDLIGKSVLLTVSRLEEKKGHDMVLRALPAVLNRFPALVYLIVGKGENDNFLRLLTRELTLENNVIFIGEADYAQLPFLYSACNIFIMLSRELRDGNIEGFGIVFIEAAACGKPVIAGDSGGAREAVMDGITGFLVDPTDTKQISEKIITLLEDRDLSDRLGLQGHKRAGSEFSWEEYYKNIRLLEDPAIKK